MEIEIEYLGQLATRCVHGENGECPVHLSLHPETTCEFIYNWGGA